MHCFFSSILIFIFHISQLFFYFNSYFNSSISSLVNSVKSIISFILNPCCSIFFAIFFLLSSTPSFPTLLNSKFFAFFNSEFSCLAQFRVFCLLQLRVFLPCSIPNFYSFINSILFNSILFPYVFYSKFC